MLYNSIILYIKLNININHLARMNNINIMYYMILGVLNKCWLLPLLLLSLHHKYDWTYKFLPITLYNDYLLNWTLEQGCFLYKLFLNVIKHILELHKTINCSMSHKIGISFLGWLWRHTLLCLSLLLAWLRDWSHICIVQGKWHKRDFLK